MDAKKTWNKHFDAYIHDLDKKKPVIWGGDLNVAPTALGMPVLIIPSHILVNYTRLAAPTPSPSSVTDLANPKPNWNKTPGYTEEETTAFARILNGSDESDSGNKFVDVWRQRNPELKHYTYWGYRSASHRHRIQLYRNANALRGPPRLFSDSIAVRKVLAGD